jgi:long-chain acyl-CoA synthetase
MVGYWDDPEATAAALQGGWLRTGDLARMDEDGYYWFVGRSKEIIIRGGSNISPLEVEEVLSQHPAVREAGVVGVPDPTWGEIVHAYVARKDGHEVTEAALKRFLEARIAAYKVPEAIRFLPDLPKGPTGKAARKTLRQWAAGVPPDSGPARKTTTETTFAGGRPPLGVNKSPDPGTQSNRSKT